jgi:hypothetical protein
VVITARRSHICAPNSGADLRQCLNSYAAPAPPSRGADVWTRISRGGIQAAVG